MIIKKVKALELALFFLPIIVFLAFKLVNLSVRLSDSNTYFYIASEITKGKILYKDIFHTNLPLFPLISVFYFYIARGSLLFFYLFAAIEAVFIYGLIYYILKSKNKNFINAYFSGILYLFSYVTLVTSNTETGIGIASIFVLLAYQLICTHKKYLLGGVFLGLSISTKAYFAPVVLAFFVSLLVSRNLRGLKMTLLGSLGTIAFIIFPFIFVAKEQMVADLFYISTLKSSMNFGVSKLPIIFSFIRYDFFLAISFTLLLFYWKKDYFMPLAALFFTIFFVFYRSFYPLYLAIIIPFLCLYFFELINVITKRVHMHSFIVPVLIYFYCIFTSFVYLKEFSQLGKVSHFEEMVQQIKEQKADYLFGSVEIVPALSYYSRVPLLEGIIDTNNALFESGFLSKENINDAAISQRTIIVSKGIYYPDRRLIEKLDASIFEKQKILSGCLEIGSYPVEGGGFVNRVYMFRCYSLENI